MKLSIGSTYKEAVMSRPITGICVVWTPDPDHCPLGEEYRGICATHPVVLNYKNIQGKNCRYHWKRYSSWWYLIADRTNGDAVVMKTGKDGGKPKMLLFHKISDAMEWIYENDKEYYDGLPNLSTMTIEAEEEK